VCVCVCVRERERERERERDVVEYFSRQGAKIHGGVLRTSGVAVH